MSLGEMLLGENYALVAPIVGGLLLVLILAILWEKLLFQRVFDDPVKGKIASVIAAWVSAAIFRIFGMADGEPFAWEAFGHYSIPVAVVGLFFLYRGIRIRRGAEADI